MDFLKPKSVVFDDSLSPELIAQIIVDKEKSSPRINAIKTAQRYFDGHSDIEKKARVYFDKNRKKFDNPAAHNARIKTSFLRLLVQQKQDYALAKTFILKVSTNQESEIDLATDDYGNAWKTFCDKHLFKLAYYLAGQTVNCGISWAYVWIDKNGMLQIESIPSELVYPVWNDRQHRILDRLVYNFVQLKFSSSSPDSVEFAEYWTKEERHLFDITNGYSEKNEIDSRKEPTFSHMTNGVSWGRVPFIAFPATDDERPLLYFVKEQLDAYEKLSSNSIDSLIDDLDPLLVFKGISPNVKDLLEARELAKLTRTISLDTDGDAHFIQAQTQIGAYLEMQEALRKDIFKFAYGVDSSDARFGGNPNQLVLKTMYQDLDTYTDGLERKFQNFIDDLKYFFDKWWEFSGRGSFDIAQSYNVRVKFDRSMMINLSDMISDTIRLQNSGISQKSILEFNPVVQDVEQELERIKAEKEEREKESENKLFDFRKKEPVEQNGQE